MAIRSLMLIDLGLADFFFPNTKYNVRVASRHYKAPELLLGYEYYDYAIDMWSFGCVLAGLLTRREPFFRGYVSLYSLLAVGLVAGLRTRKVFFPFCLSDSRAQPLGLPDWLNAKLLFVSLQYQER